MIRALAMAVAFGALGAALAAPAARADTDIVAGGATYGLHVMNWRDIPFRTIVRQQFDYSCGSAALATLLRYHYGRSVTEADVFKEMYAHGDQAKIQKVGFSLLDMKHYLDHAGLKSDGYRLTLAQLQSLDHPAIAVMKIGPYRHFVVIKGITPDKVLVGDPALGLKTYTTKEFAAQWDGILFAVHDDETVKGAFNRVAEWRPWASAPLGAAMSDDTLSKLTWQMPSIYQLSIRNDIMATAPLPGSP